MNDDKNYYAFISYKRDDQKWAEWLQGKLEHYKLPTNLNGRENLPKEIRPVFRDKSELAAGVLADEIQKALDNSKYLIVICSPHSAKSEWVNKEVQAFIDSGRTDKIIPFIIEGTPNSNNDETECFPKAIRELPAENELLGVNINEMGRDAAAVKVIAQMFGLRFDDLWQRHEREKRRRRNWIITASVAAFLVMVGIAGWIWHQNVMLKKQRWEMLENQSKLVAKEVAANAKDDSYLARLVALEILPKDVANPIDRPYTADAERALRKACYYNSAIFNCDDYGFYKFVSENNKVYVSTDNSLIKVFDTETGECVRNLDLGCFNNMDLSRDGKILVLTTDSVVKIYDTETFKEKMLLKGTDFINTVVLSEDGAKILTVADDKTLKIWDATTGMELLCLKNIYSDLYLDNNNFDKRITSFSPDGKSFVFASSKAVYEDFPTIGNISANEYEEKNSENDLTVYDAVTGDELYSWQGHNNAISSVAFSPDGKKIVSSSYDATICIWDIETGAEIKKMFCNSSVYCVDFSNDGKYIVSGEDSGSVIVWDATTGERISDLLVHNSYLEFVQFGKDDRKVVSLSSKQLAVTDFKTNNNSCELSKSYYPEMDFESDTMYDSSGNKCLIIGENTTDVIVYDKKTREIKTLEYVCTVNSAVFSIDGKRFVVALACSPIIVYDIETCETVCIFNGHVSHTHYATFSHDMKRIVSASADKTVRVWDIDTGRQLLVMTGHTKSVEKAEFSPDDKYIVSCSYDKTIRVWDAETGECLHIIDGFTDMCGSVSFSSDGRYIITSSEDGTIRQYDFPPLQDLIDQTRERFKNRPLTDEERKMYYLE